MGSSSSPETHMVYTCRRKLTNLDSLRRWILPIAAIVCAITGIFAVPGAIAQEYPGRIIRLIVRPGDQPIFARLIATAARTMGQSVGREPTAQADDRCKFSRSLRRRARSHADDYHTTSVAHWLPFDPINT
jgi:hypothetical protein